MLNYACWNLTSFNVRESSVLAEKFVIFGVVETWNHQESTIDLPEFSHFHLPATKRKNTKRGHRSGGVIVYFKNNITPGISLIYEYKRDYGLLIKLEKSFFFFHLDFDIFLAVIYMYKNPKCSQQDNEEAFAKLSQDIAELSCL